MKKVRIISGKDGKIGMSFEGFAGNECFLEADRIKARLKELGIKTETEFVELKEDFVSGHTEGIKNEQKH